MNPLEAVQRRLAKSAAVLLLLGVLTGFYVAAGMTGQIPADGRIALSAHLNALLGSFWMFALGYTLPMLRFTPTGAARLPWLTTVPNFGNWFVTAIKAWWKVAGINPTGEARNDAIFGLLTVLVVVPSVAAAVAWVWGFSGRANATPPS